MKYCEKCKVNLHDTKDICPLCQNELIAKEGNSDILCKAFPTIPTVYSQFHMFFKVLIFLSITSVVVSTFINLLNPKDGFWCLFVLVGNAYVWVAVITTVVKRRNLSKVIVYQVFWVSAISVIYDVWVGYSGWSVDYAIPAICITSMVSIFIVSIVTQQKLEEYALYIIINAIILIVPIVLMITGVTSIIWPSLVAVSVDVLIISAVVIFGKKDWLSEFKRRFHM